MEPEVVRIQPHAEGEAQRPLLTRRRWRLHKEQEQEVAVEQEEAEEMATARRRRQKPPPVWLCWRTTACVYLTQTTQEPLYLQAEQPQMMGRWSVRPALCHRVTAIKPQRRQGSHGQHDRLMTGAPGTWSGSEQARNGSKTAFGSPTSFPDVCPEPVWIIRRFAYENSSSSRFSSSGLGEGWSDLWLKRRHCRPTRMKTTLMRSTFLALQCGVFDTRGSAHSLG
jgi:hypothetical protein